MEECNKYISGQTTSNMVEEFSFSDISIEKLYIKMINRLKLLLIQRVVALV